MRFYKLAPLLLLLAGCVAGPQYARVELPVASSYRIVGGTDAITAQWWLAYDDATLNELQADALSGNFTIEAALARVDQARAVLRLQTASTLPIVETRSSVGRAVQSQNSGVGILSRIIPDYPRTVTDVSAGLGSTWDIDFAGGNRRRGEIAAADLSQSAWGVAAARLAVAADLADAYWGLRAAQLRQSRYGHLVALARHRHEIMMARLRLGAASDQEVADSKANLAQLEAAKPLVDADVSRYEAVVNSLLGKHSSNRFANFVEIKALPVVPNPESGLPADLLSRRPDVLIAEQRVIAANAGIGLALSEYYPKISLSALLGTHGSRLSNVSDPGSIIAFGGVGLRWRLFDFGRIDAEVAVAKGRKREAVAAYRQAVLIASTEVEQCFFRLDGARNEMALLESAVKSATSAVNLEQEAYGLGGRSLESLLSRQLELSELELRFLNAQERALRASVACYRALGIVP